MKSIHPRLRNSFLVLLALILLLSACRVRFEYSILYPLDEKKEKAEGRKREEQKKGVSKKENVKKPTRTTEAKAAAKSNAVKPVKMAVAKPEHRMRLDWVNTSKAEESFSNRSYCCTAAADGGVIDFGEFSGAIWFERKHGESFVLEADSDVPNQYIVKYDKEGDFEWAQKIIPYADADPLDACFSQDGYVYVLGYYQDSISIPDGNGNQVTFSANKVNRSAYICCYNAVGDFQWARNIEHCATPRQKAATAARSIACTPEGDLIVAGGFINGIVFSPESDSQVSNITNSWETTGFWAKYTSGGDLQWVRYIDGSLDSDACGISIREDGSILFGSSGIGNNIAHKGTEQAVSLRTPVAGRSHMALYCDAQGYVQRFSQYESASGSGHATAASGYEDGMVLFGYMKRASISFPTEHGIAEIYCPPGTITHSYVARLGSGGKAKWVRWLKPTDDKGHVISQENDLVVDAYGNIHALALFRGNAEITNPGTKGVLADGSLSYDQFRLLSFSPSGDLLRAIRIGDGRPMVINSIAPFADGKGLYVSGHFSESIEVEDEGGKAEKLDASGKTQRLLIRYAFDDRKGGLLSWF